uniref:Cyclindependent kinase putative n=1 Tax=Albugo laibachii Nc14 TaxID=890382 RepID=F0W6W2_9STRA|nr:cyclindependent kinase putative [Albugo laibachii Nc14]|eukprot:CCA16857.1 cyclindependent kinase putative [Albugo laibachii Nc14]
MNKYSIETVIGEGTYGIVYKAREISSQKLVAIKKFKSLDSEHFSGDKKHEHRYDNPSVFVVEQLSKREVQVCAMLNHPNIVSYRHCFRKDGHLHLVFDYVGDSLAKLLRQNPNGLKAELAQHLIYQLCQALHCCHSNQIIHRADVKPENILLDQNYNVRLCDFGVARTVQLEGDVMTDYVATRWYRPPEQELRLDRYSFDADIWSVGCILVELMTGKPLFPGKTQIDQLTLIQECLGPLPSHYCTKLPKGLIPINGTSSFDKVLMKLELPEGTIDFLHRTVNYDPCRRMTASESLEHPFLRKSNEAYKLEKAKVRATDKGKSKCNTDDGIEEDICYEDGPTRDSDSTLEMLGAKKHSSGKRSHHEMPESFNISSGINECFEDIQEIIEAESPSTMKKQLQSEKRGIFTNRTGYDGYEDDFEDYL